MKIYIPVYDYGHKYHEIESTECRLDHKKFSSEIGRIFHFGTTYTPSKIFSDPEGVSLYFAKALPMELKKHEIDYRDIEWGRYNELK